MKMKEKQMCAYIGEWMNERYPIILDFKEDVTARKDTEIYTYEEGHHLMDIIRDVESDIRFYFKLESGQHLIPAKFTTPHKLIRCLINLRDKVKTYMKDVNGIPAEYKEKYEVRETYNILEDICAMANHCIESFEVEIIDDTYMKPYLDMKACLDSEDIDEFVTILDSIFNKIPYLIHKGRVNEALFHCVIHAVMNQLGFECDSEKPTSKGRMDMWLKMKNRVYIFEFKYSKEDMDMSKEAIQQIKDRKYADQYLIKKTRVIAVGVTFGKEKRNVIGSDKEVLTGK